jgi:ATP-dependent protease HslVU (ClpYQ) ATPase subunit
MSLYENIGSAVLIIRLIGIMEICWSYIVNEVKAKKKILIALHNRDSRFTRRKIIA